MIPLLGVEAVLGGEMTESVAVQVPPELQERFSVELELLQQPEHRLFGATALGFQVEMGLPGVRSVPAPGGGAPPSLVTTTHNCPQTADSDKFCPDSQWVRGTCTGHGQERWVLVPCKRRTCEVCGPNGQTPSPTIRGSKRTCPYLVR